MLLIAVLRTVQVEITKFKTRRQLMHLSPAQLNDLAMSPEAVTKEAKKASYWGLAKGIIHSLWINRR